MGFCNPGEEGVSKRRERNAAVVLTEMRNVTDLWMSCCVEVINDIDKGSYAVVGVESLGVG